MLNYTVDDLYTTPVSRALAEPVPNAQNQFADAVGPQTIASGKLLGDLEQTAGAIFNGKESFANDVLGFRLGVDEADGVAKFFIGDTDTYLNWDGQQLLIQGVLQGSVINGSTITGGTIQTSATGDRIAIEGASNSIRFYDDADIVAEIKPRVDGQNRGFEIFTPYDQGVGTTVGSKFQMLYDAVDSEGIITMYAWDDAISGIQLRYLLSEDITRIELQSARFDDDIDPTADEGNDIGSSSLKWDDIWCDVMHRTSESSPSDVRLKENIVPLDVGLKEVMKLRPVEFDWKKTGKHSFGFIAQELQQHLPKLVSPITDKSASEYEEVVVVPEKRVRGKVVEKAKTKRVKIPGTRRTVEVKPEDDPNGASLLQIESSALVPILLKAVQELAAKVEALEKDKKPGK